MEAYSDLKAAWHIDRIQRLRVRLPVMPLHVQLILSDLCNQDCHFCAYRSSTGLNSAGFGVQKGSAWISNPKRALSTEKALEIVTDCAAIGVRAIQFTGGGEPTVHKDFLRVVGAAQDAGMETGLVTNGVRVKPHEVFERLTWVRVSLDAGTEDTYRRTRRSSAFRRVLDNCDYLAGTRYFGVGFVVTPENWTEIYAGADLARDMGAKYIRFSAVFSTEGSAPYKDIHQDIRDQLARAAELETAHFAVADLFGDRISDLDVGAPDYPHCFQQGLTVYIGGNGKVYRCCNTAYTPLGEVGDLNDMRFADWARQREDLRAFDPKQCTACQFNGKNRLLNYLADDEPQHVAFA